MIFHRTTPAQAHQPAQRDWAGRTGSEELQPHDWYANPLTQRFQEPLPPDRPTIAPAAKRTTAQHSPELVLSAREFEHLLARERNLADRGTRLFSLMVLRRLGGKREGWSRLAQDLR